MVFLLMVIVVDARNVGKINWATWRDANRNFIDVGFVLHVQVGTSFQMQRVSIKDDRLAVYDQNGFFKLGRRSRLNFQKRVELDIGLTVVDSCNIT